MPNPSPVVFPFADGDIADEDALIFVSQEMMGFQGSVVTHIRLELDLGDDVRTNLLM